MAKMPDMIAQWKKVCDFERIFASVVFVVCSTIELYSRGLIAFVISLCRIRKRRRRKQIRRQALLYYIQENIGRLFPKDHRDDSSITINPSLFRKPFSVYVDVNFILSEALYVYPVAMVTSFDLLPSISLFLCVLLYLQGKAPPVLILGAMNLPNLRVSRPRIVESVE